MTANENRIIHALFQTTGLLPQKQNIVSGISGGRTESTKDLSSSEVDDLIKYLRGQQPATTGNDAANKMRRTIISKAHQLHWHVPGTQKVDMRRVDEWCKQYGYLHKKLNDYTVQELPKLVTQFNNVFADVLRKL